MIVPIAILASWVFVTLSCTPKGFEGIRARYIAFKGVIQGTSFPSFPTKNQDQGD